MGGTQPHPKASWHRVAKKQDHKALPQVMQASQDRLWLSGEEGWRGRAKQSSEGTSDLPESWNTPSEKSSTGWLRQTLRPVGIKILFPLAWSPFFLLITAVPLALPNRTPVDDQITAAGFFAVSWLLILIPLFLIRYSQPTDVVSIHTLPLDWPTFALASAIFGLHLAIHPAFGWISYALFWIAWFRTYGMIRDVVTSPAGRWLLPVDSSDWKSSAHIREGWQIKSEFWTSGPIAVLNADSGQITLTGVSRGNDRFISIALIGHSGFVHDPFADPSSRTKLSEPQVMNSGLDWPSRLLPA